MGPKIDVKPTKAENNDIKNYTEKDMEEMMTLANKREQTEKSPGSVVEYPTSTPEDIEPNLPHNRMTLPGLAVTRVKRPVLICQLIQSMPRSDLVCHRKVYKESFK